MTVYECEICRVPLHDSIVFKQFQLDYKTLCANCYREKDLTELSKIASLSTEQVIKELAKIDVTRKKKDLV